MAEEVTQEESETLTLQKNQKFSEKSSFSTFHIIGNWGKKPLLNTQRQTNIKKVLATKDLLWCVSYSNLSQQKVFKLVYFSPH